MEYQHGNVDPLHARAIEERLGQVQRGMKVVDAAGQDLGKVDYVKLGDPDAVTTRGDRVETPGEVIAAPSPAVQESGGTPIIAVPVGPADEDLIPDVPAEEQSRLLRYGYVKVDGPFLFGKNRYVRADQIAGVSGDTVQLNVNKDELPVEQ